jgi:L-amino acid N-acyltransferase YncA
MATYSEIRTRYPREIDLDESLGSPGPSFFRVRPGGKRQLRRVPLRLMGAADKDSIHLLARNLPQEDLLFLRHDISVPTIVDDWVHDIEKQATLTLLAEPDGTLEGFASLHLNPVRWARKIGEIATIVAPEWQSRGLGEGLCSELVTLAGLLELRKLTAMMIAEHKSARALFERLGFRVQALLPHWVEDSEGQSRDLLLMAYDLPHQSA